VCCVIFCWGREGECADAREVSVNRPIKRKNIKGQTVRSLFLRGKDESKLFEDLVVFVYKIKRSSRLSLNKFLVIVHRPLLPPRLTNLPSTLLLTQIRRGNECLAPENACWS
jgi:hypothetical protein